MDYAPLVIVGGWILSLAALAATIIAVIRVTKNRKSTEAPVSSWVVYTIGIFATAFFMVLSQEIAGLTGSEGSPKLLDALFGTLQMFGMNRDIGLNTESLQWMGNLLPCYVIYNAALFLAAPTGVIGSVITLAVEFIGVFRLRLLASGKPVYIFSEATNRSLTLAKSIKEALEKKGGCVIVFSGVEKDDESTNVIDAKSESMLCLPQSMSYLAKQVTNSSALRTFVFSSENEIENISGGVELARKLAASPSASNKAPHILIFSSSPVGGPIVDAVAAELNDNDKISVFIQRVDWIRSTVDTMIDEYPLFTTGLAEDCIYSKIDDEHVDGGFKPKLAFDLASNRRRVVVVGNGAFAKEFVKCALWATQLGDDIKTQIDVVMGSDGRLKDELQLECPELFATDGRPYQGYFNVSFEPIDPETGAYQEYLLDRDLGDDAEKRDHPTYVVIALDDDLTCAKIALRTCEILEQRRFRAADNVCAPFIAAVINDSELANGLRHMEKRNRFYSVQPVGSNEDSFDYESIFNPRLLRYATNVNRVYGSGSIHGEGDKFKAAIERADTSFANSEYNQRSSMAASLHRKYSLFLFCRKTNLACARDVDWTLGLDAIALKNNESGKVVKGEILKAYDDYLHTQDFSWLSKIEHDRWSAYVATEGYEYAATSEMAKMLRLAGRQEYAIGHLHGCLIPFEELPNLDKELAKHSNEERTPFQKLDDDILKSLGVIAMVHATEKSYDTFSENFSEIWHEYFPDPVEEAEEAEE